MARVAGFRHGFQLVRLHPTEVECYYQRIPLDDGDLVLHLSTFGSNDRASSPKSSQSIQLDRRAARALLGILLESFPGLASD